MTGLEPARSGDFTILTRVEAKTWKWRRRILHGLLDFGAEL